MEKIFLSYRERDINHCKKLVNLLKQPESPFVEYSFLSRINLTETKKKKIKKQLEEWISESSIIVNLVGDDAHETQWNDFETKIAVSLEKPIIAVRIPKTRGKKSAELNGIGLHEIPWELEAISTAFSAIKNK